MDEISSLAKSLMVLDDKLASCMKCGFCQAFCPVFDTTGKEGDVTRGKIALVENLAQRLPASNVFATGGAISVTPIKVDLTRYQALEQVASWVQGFAP